MLPIEKVIFKREIITQDAQRAHLKYVWQTVKISHK